MWALSLSLCFILLVCTVASNAWTQKPKLEGCPVLPFRLTHAWIIIYFCRLQSNASDNWIRFTLKTKIMTNKLWTYHNLVSLTLDSWYNLFSSYLTCTETKACKTVVQITMASYTESSGLYSLCLSFWQVCSGAQEFAFIRHSQMVLMWGDPSFWQSCLSYVLYLSASSFFLSSLQLYTLKAPSSVNNRH